MKSFYLLLGILCFTFGLSGCSTIVDKTYRPQILDNDQKALLAVPVENSQVTIDRIKNDGSRAIADIIVERYPDYLPLGESSFRINAVSDQELKHQAVSVGASLVAVFQGWVGTAQTGTIGNAVSIGGSSAVAIASPINVDVYKYNAIFLAKYAGKKEKFGLNITNLPADIQQKLERNKGVLIVNVSREPAFDANLLVGDVVIATNGNQVINDASVGLLVRDACRKGGAIVVSVIRGVDGKQRDISIPNCM